MVPVALGKKIVEQRLGVVAELCRKCRVPRAVELWREARVDHVYHLTLGRGQLLRCFARCLHCGERFEVEPSDYESVAKHDDGNVLGLIERTSPRLNRANQTAAARHQRFAALRAPLLFHGGELDELYGADTPFDRTSALAVLVALAAPFAIFWLCAGIGSLLGLSPAAARDLDEYAGVSAVATLALGLLVAFVLFARYPHRRFRRRILPRVVAGLRPLRPARDELAECLAILCKHGHRIPAWVSADALMAALRAPARTT